MYDHGVWRYPHPKPAPGSPLDLESIVPPAGASAGFAALDTRAATENAGLRRDGAALHTLVVSGEDDSSAIEPGELVDWYQGLAPKRAPPTLSAIVPMDAARYLAAHTLLGGHTAGPDDDAWQAALDRVGVMAAGLRREFFLSGRPTLETIEVAAAIPVDGEPGMFTTITFEPAVTGSDGEIENAFPQLAV